jgi:hypothetical protein
MNDKDETTNYGVGWKTVRHIYLSDKKNIYRSLKWPLFLSLVPTLVGILSDGNSSVLLESIINITISICPAILGFTLSGYALIIGLSNSKYIDGLLEYKQKGKSMFQSVNTVFAVVLFFSFFTTILAIVIKVIFECQIIINSTITVDILNWSVVFIILFLLIYTVNSIKDIVINIFNFGQFIQAKKDSEK